MINKENLSKYQKTAYQVFYNAFKEKKISQAFLLSGERGSPVFDCALYLAKSLICEEDVLACEECFDCLRVENGTYTDIIVIDGSEESIKKEQIEEIQKRFNKSSIEEKGIKIYIINLIENCGSVGAINSMLKFLEEPTENTYAILTTNNINYVLPTIISRCQLIRINKMPQEELIKDLLNNGFSKEDSNILSSYYSNKEDIEQAIKDADYYHIKDSLLDLFYEYLKGKDLNYYYQVNFMKELSNNKISARMFLLLMETLIKDLFNFSSQKELYFIEQEDLIKKLSNKVKNKEEILKETIESLDYIDRKGNVSLIIDKLLYQISRR